MMKNLAIIGGAAVVVVLVIVFMFQGGTSSSGTSSAAIDSNDTEGIKFALIDAEEACNEAWAQVQNQITRRDNVIPKMMAMISNPGSDLQSIQSEIDQLNNQLANLTEKDEAYGKTQAALQLKLAGLVEGVNSQNASNDATEFQYLIIELEGAENRISVERKRYNSKVREYNTLVKKYGDKFPDYELIPYFEAQ
jgi:LemA protein